MSVEVFLFLAIGAIAIVSAGAMVATKNAVHSALFLIINFLCVAFLYILLDASFLALVQVAVYAGAIMVLFLFVIMLLGAEKISEDTRQLLWLPRLALVLALSFLIVVSIALISGEIDKKELPEEMPMVGVVNAVPGAESLDIFFNGGEFFIEGVELAHRASGDISSIEFISIEPGEFEVSVAAPGMSSELGLVTLETGQVRTLIIYGDPPRMAAIDQDMSISERHQSRLTVFNALTSVSEVNLVEIGGDFAFDDDEEAAAAPLIVENLRSGTASEVMLVNEDQPAWAFVRSDSVEEIVQRLEDFEIERDSSVLLILTGELNGISGDIDPLVVSVSTGLDEQFGGPAMMAEALYLRYVLPFEMVALLLLAAMVGAIVLTQRGAVMPKPGRSGRRKVSRPLVNVVATQTGQEIEAGQ
jgi:NADH:ubiquinone oxidoreductase subunit 6 (subunit J)